jgi:hypothetical protein
LRRVQEATMNRHLAHALGATALGVLLLQPVTTMADPPAHARNENSAKHRVYVVHHLPPRHRVVHYHGHPYYYADGAWYRPYGRRYIVTDPPVGLVVSFLPHFGAMLYVGDIPHYRAGPVYYAWDTRARGYVVTDRPDRRR